MSTLKHAFGIVWRLAVAGMVSSVILLGLYANALIAGLDLDRATIVKRAHSPYAVAVPTALALPGGVQNVQIAAPLHLPGARVPKFVKDAFIAAEDHWFYYHPGVNPLASVRALLRYTLSGSGTSSVPGGSTITMQLAKTLFLSGDKTPARKIDEFIIAIYLTFVFSKDEILAMYLNNSYFGDGVYGIEAAARHYFGRSVGYDPKISRFEAAALARSVRRPSEVNPRKTPERMVALASKLITEIAGRGLIGTAEAAGATRPTFAKRSEKSWTISTHYLRDLAFADLLPDAVREYRGEAILALTFEPEAQLYAERAIRKLLAEAAPFGYDQAAVVVMRPDGEIAALVGGSDYSDLGGFDIAVHGARSPGSLLKPFAYVCALEKGLTPNSILHDARTKFPGGYIPRNNDGRYLGKVTARKALMLSRNPPAVELLNRYGVDCFLSALRRFGVRTKVPPYFSSVVGSASVPLLDLVAGYAAFANGGHPVRPSIVWHVRTSTGRHLYRKPAVLAAPIVSRRVYCEITAMLRDVTSSGGTGKRAAFAHPSGGKTGTSTGNRDVLFVGYSGYYVTGVWLGVTGPGRPTRGLSGGELPAEAFRWLMSNLHEGKPAREIGCDAVVASAGPAAPG